jgi:hypothetical protein
MKRQIRLNKNEVIVVDFDKEKELFVLCFINDKEKTSTELLFKYKQFMLLIENIKNSNFEDKRFPITEKTVLYFKKLNNIFNITLEFYESDEKIELQYNLNNIMMSELIRLLTEELEAVDFDLLKNK